MTSSNGDPPGLDLATLRHIIEEIPKPNTAVVASNYVPNGYLVFMDQELQNPSFRLPSAPRYLLAGRVAALAVLGLNPGQYYFDEPMLNWIRTQASGDSDAYG